MINPRMPFGTDLTGVPVGLSDGLACVRIHVQGATECSEGTHRGIGHPTMSPHGLVRVFIEFVPMTVGDREVSREGARVSACISVYRALSTWTRGCRREPGRGGTYTSVPTSRPALMSPMVIICLNASRRPTLRMLSTTRKMEGVRCAIGSVPGQVTQVPGDRRKQGREGRQLRLGAPLLCL